MIILSFEILVVLYFVFAICVDYVVNTAMLWITSYWIIVQTCTYLFFAVIVIIEAIEVAKNENKKIACWFTFWNISRSYVAARYFLFILSDLASNYKSFGLGDKILSAVGLQIMIIPLFAYGLFEVIIRASGELSIKSILIGGLVGIGGIALGALLVLL